MLKVNDENSRIRIQYPDPDPLVSGMDPRIRIRVHTKMSWIRNTGKNVLILLVFRIYDILVGIRILLFLSKIKSPKKVSKQ
jgi:hypothetical protein